MYFNGSCVNESYCSVHEETIISNSLTIHELNTKEISTETKFLSDLNLHKIA